MFESTYIMKLTEEATEAPHRDRAYQECWQPLPKVFDPTTRDARV